MNVRKLLIVGLCLGFAAIPAMGQGIANSAHDFSDGAGFGSDSWNAGGEICEPCHVPHNPNPGGQTANGAPLWNHTLTADTGFTMYTGVDLQGTTDASPGGISKLCLSCHDGTVNLDAYGGVAGSTPLTGAALVSKDLSDDHPISITYTDATATSDGELFAPSSTNSGLGSTIQADMLFSDKVECGSCHDVHNTANQDPLLRKTNSGSQLCLTCHDK